MWVWGVGGLATAGGVAFLWAGGPGCHCGPCLGRAAAAGTRTSSARPPAPPPGVRFDEPPLAAKFRPAPEVVPAAHAEPAVAPLSRPDDPF